MFLSLFNHHKHNSHNLFQFKKSHHRDDAHSHADKLHGHFDQLIQDLSHRVFEFKKDEKACDDKPVVMQDAEEEKSEDSSEGQKLSQDAMLLAIDGEMISDTPNFSPVEDVVMSVEETVEEVVVKDEIVAPVEDMSVLMRETESVAAEFEIISLVSENPESNVVTVLEAPDDPINQPITDQNMDMSLVVDMTSDFTMPTEEVMVLESLMVEAVSAEEILPNVIALESITEVVVEPTLELTTGEVVTDAGETALLPTMELNVVEDIAPEALPLEVALVDEPLIAQETGEMLPDVTIQTLTEEAPVDDVILQNVAPLTEDDDIVLENVVEPKSENCFEISIKDHGFNWNFNMSGDYKSWGNWSSDNGDCGSLGDFVGNLLDNVFKSWGGDHHTADAELCQ